MHVPSNMTEKQVIEEINIVVNRIAHKYTFHGYEIQDIKQESFIICMEALPRYDEERPLENFLSVHLSNRLKNFVRDNYFIKDEEEKRRVVMPGQLSNEAQIIGDATEVPHKLDYEAMVRILDIKLPALYREDYLKIISDVYVPKKRKEEVLDFIYEVLEEHGHAEG